MNQEMRKGVFICTKHFVDVYFRPRINTLMWFLGKVIMARHSSERVEQLRTSFSYQFYLISPVPSVWFIGRFNNTHKH